MFPLTREAKNSIISKGYEFLHIDGTTKTGDRLKIVNDFQIGVGAPIFLLTSQVGGLCLMLTKAYHVIVVNPAWNPDMQSLSDVEPGPEDVTVLRWQADH